LKNAFHIAIRITVWAAFVLALFLLLSCEEEPETWKQDTELKQYFDRVLDRLENDSFPRDQIVLKKVDMGFGVARTYERGIMFNKFLWPGSPDSYIELVMLHEVLHACYGWQPETKLEHDRMFINFTTHNLEMIEAHYEEARAIISEINQQ
jgi:hypothetical protein